MRSIESMVALYTMKYSQGNKCMSAHEDNTQQFPYNMHHIAINGERKSIKTSLIRKKMVKQNKGIQDEGFLIDDGISLHCNIY